MCFAEWEVNGFLCLAIVAVVPLEFTTLDTVLAKMPLLYLTGITTHYPRWWAIGKAVTRTQNRPLAPAGDTFYLPNE